MRESPSLEIIPALKRAGAQVRAFDPEGMGEARKLLPGVVFCGDAYDTLEGADALVIVTEWNEFRALDLKRVKAALKQPIVIDLRNIYVPAEMAAAGFQYSSIGRPSGGAAETEGEAVGIPASLLAIAGKTEAGADE
jgi:UDPglucose 6-dehydrogenase